MDRSNHFNPESRIIVHSVCGLNDHGFRDHGLMIVMPWNTFHGVGHGWCDSGVIR